MVPVASRAIEAEIDRVERALLSIKDELAGWSDAATSLALSAADGRARNAELGRGIGGALLGAKYRAAARQVAASGNAAIAREVAGKRRAIAEAKQALREKERDLRWRLRDLKADLRDARLRECEQARRMPSRPVPPVDLSPTRRSAVDMGAAPVAGNGTTAVADIKVELRHLKELHLSGALDAVAYERARIALLSPHLST